MTRESLSNTHHVLAGLGLLSALPAFHFVTGSILKYELGLLPGVSIYPVPPVILLGGTFERALYIGRPRRVFLCNGGFDTDRDQDCQHQALIAHDRTSFVFGLARKVRLKALISADNKLSYVLLSAGNGLKL